ncbi:MAG: DUF2312 domain-containing protein [Alphaproteobacteria bacterium]|nr:MAG: DUF2312 domain-containing protein [Alphaproteobacteria bacterium]
MKEVAADPHRFAKEHLKAFVERIERVEDERRELSNDKRDIYAEAKANGFSTRAIKNVVKIRNYEREHGREARLSEEAILETYMKALGMLN